MYFRSTIAKCDNTIRHVIETNRPGCRYMFQHSIMVPYIGLQNVDSIILELDL